MSVDPHAEKYPNINPYVYVANNPINAIDPDGRDIIFVINRTRYKFDGTNLVNVKGNVINPKSYEGTHVGKMVNGYKNLAKLDKHYKMQIQKLIDSKNQHLIDTDRKSSRGGGVVGGNEFDDNTTTEKKVLKGISVGSTTTYNFDEYLKVDFEKKHGVKKTDETTISHELQHQYDYEIGNMGDSYMKESNNDNPGEMRAVRNEDIAREKLNIEKRPNYEGKKDR